MKKHVLTKKQQKTLAIAAIIIFLVFIAAIIVFVGIPLVRFASSPEKFREWVDTRGALGRFAYMGMVILQTVVAIIPGEPFEIAAGYAFGALEGTLLCLLASCIGSMITFLLVRRFGIKIAELFFSYEKLCSLRFLKTSPKRDFLYLIIFMVPGTPKDLFCYFAGLTDMSIPVWFLISFVGRIPSVITSTIGGNALGTKNYIYAVIVFTITLVISCIGFIIYNRIQKKSQ